MDKEHVFLFFITRNYYKINIGNRGDDMIPLYLTRDIEKLVVAIFAALYPFVCLF